MSFLTSYTEIFKNQAYRCTQGPVGSELLEVLIGGHHCDITNHMQQRVCAFNLAAAQWIKCVPA